MKVTKAINWLTAKMFQPDQLGNPIKVMIVDYYEEKGAKGMNRRLRVEHANKNIYEFDIFGSTMNGLIDLYGDDSEKWVGKNINVSLVKVGDKDTKRISPIN